MSNLDGLHPTVRFKAEKLIRLAAGKGINIIITQGLRTIAYQNQLYAQGRTTKGSIVTNAKGGYSYHNFGLAFDFAILNPDGKTVNWNTNIDLNKDGEKDWIQVAKLGESIGLESGAFWKSFLDIPHFQLTFGLTTTQLRAGKKAPYTSDKDVVEFQTILKKLGANIEIDGIYGESSINAVKQMQKKYGLTVDGLVGVKTYDMFLLKSGIAKVDSTTNNTNTEKIMWGKTELRVGQIGKVTVLQDINVWEDSPHSSGEIVHTRTLKKGGEFRVYKYRPEHGGQYYLGSGEWVTKMPSHIKYETPSKAMLEKLNNK